jgi:anti-anti-sigma factor
VRTLETGEAYHERFPYEGAFAGGRPISGVWAMSATRVRDGLALVFENVAERMRALQAEERYGALLDATSDWVSVADGEGRLLYINPAGRRMIGLAADEPLEGRRIGAFSPDWARERVLGEALEAARRDGVWRGNLARRHRDGHEVPVSQVIVARTNPDGEVDFYATIARDMTSEHAAQAALRESEERFRIAFEQAPIGMSLLDLEGRFVQVNDAYCTVVRRSREELLDDGRPIDITHPDDVALTEHAVRMLILGEVPLFRFEKRYLAPDGDTIWVEISGSLFRDADGQPQYLIGQIQDLGERRVAHTLQRSMLTTRLPDVDGVEFAVRYLPGSADAEVSGDWYDVIPLTAGRVGVVIGDVVGRGIEAAATMSQLRTAVRAYAVEGLEPAQLVARLHRLVDRLGVGLSTTLAYLELDPFTGAMRYVSAGHLPPLLSEAAGGSRFLEGGRSTPLGAAPAGLPVRQEDVVLGPGDTILLYTDGLVERRVDPIDDRLEDLRRAMACAPGDLDAALEHLTATLGEDGARHDDVALLALRRLPQPTEPLAVTIDGAVEQLAPMRTALRSWLVGAGATAAETADVLIAVGEACANAVEHAGPRRAGPVDVRARMVGAEAVLTVRDRGTWRPPSARADRGHGLRLMRLLMDAVEVTPAEDGTHVQLRLALAQAPAGRARAAPEARAAAGPDGASGTPPAAPGAPGVAVDRQFDVPVARLQGEVDLARVPALRAALAGAVAPGDPGLVVDLTAVDYLDSAGVHLLHELARTLAGRGQGLRAVARDAPVVRILEIVSLEAVLPLDDSVAAAAAALQPAEGPG